MSMTARSEVLGVESHSTASRRANWLVPGMLAMRYDEPTFIATYLVSRNSSEGAKPFLSSLAVRWGLLRSNSVGRLAAGSGR